jgi:hypothetical protein
MRILEAVLWATLIVLLAVTFTGWTAMAVRLIWEWIA